MSLTNASPEAAARVARISSRKLATLPTSARNNALQAVHDALFNARDEILAANAKDLELAKKATANGELNPAFRCLIEDSYTWRDNSGLQPLIVILVKETLG